jgi:hypothetical protein
VRLAIALALVTVATLLLIGAFAFLVWSLYLFLTPYFEPAGTALVTGILVLLLSGVVLWGAKGLSR